MAEIVLNGITWAHSRGINSLAGSGAAFFRIDPGIEINWKKRTLQEFADYPIEKLTNHYDLLIIDHPWVGCAAATESVLPLERIFTYRLPGRPGGPIPSVDSHRKLLITMVINGRWLSTQLHLQPVIGKTC